VTNDKIINASEGARPLRLRITGTVGGDAKAGRYRHLEYPITSTTPAPWQRIKLQHQRTGERTANDADKVIDAKVTATDTAGNSVTATATHAYTTDTRCERNHHCRCSDQR